MKIFTKNPIQNIWRLFFILFIGYIAIELVLAAFGIFPAKPTDKFFGIDLGSHSLFAGYVVSILSLVLTAIFSIFTIVASLFIWAFFEDKVLERPVSYRRWPIENSIDPDEIIEAAKKQAFNKPGVLIEIDLSDSETFSVIYDIENDKYSCSRSASTKTVSESSFVEVAGIKVDEFEFERHVDMAMRFLRTDNCQTVGNCSVSLKQEPQSNEEYWNFIRLEARSRLAKGLKPV